MLLAVLLLLIPVCDAYLRAGRARMAAPGELTMASTYDSLTDRVLGRLAAVREVGSGPLWIGIAGGPGAGKSTLAAAVCARVNAATASECSVVLPMDGFHYSRAQLRELDPPDASSYLPRRGSPWTFDAEGLYEALAAAKAAGEATLPTYRCRAVCTSVVRSHVQLCPHAQSHKARQAHAVFDSRVAVRPHAAAAARSPTQSRAECSCSDRTGARHGAPVPTAHVGRPRVPIDPVCSRANPCRRAHSCVFVEGNYLLMRDEPRWAPVATLFDDTWFIACADAEEQRRCASLDLFRRALRVPTCAHTASVGTGG